MVSEQADRPKRQQVDVRREEILLATVKAVESRGMATLRVADIAATLGVSSGLVFYHFETKDALFVEALEYAVDRDLRRLDRALARGSSAVDRLKRVLASYGPTGHAQGWRLWIDAWSNSLREPTIRRALGRLDKRWRSALVTAIEDGVAAGEFDCPDPVATVARLGALMDGLSVSALVYRSVSRSQLRTWVREAAAAELGIAASRLL